ncbi:MAG TPA: RagB/SusD family nutrient uptake outer membrane protein, partial [Longimicrobiales bacterium]|nr:RagB/SusD family nutrient uptake outer membrane protein [Longimicrobiales bacterium]
SRTYMLAGFANRYLGENFCEMTYDEGPLQDRTTAFDQAIERFKTAIQEAGSDPDAADFVTASHAGLAAAYLGKGEWSSALSEAAMVPTEFELAAHYNQSVNNNVIYDETWDRPEITAYKTLAASFDPIDPRTPFTKCGVYADPDDPSSGVIDTGAGCGAQNGADGLTPHWRQDKYDENGSDIPIAKGTEMRLIEAEAALRDNDLATFTAKVNEVREFYGADPIAQPAEAGELEYPNALDDGWSILDAERYLTLWLEGRRFWDLYRWDHPFLNAGSVIYPGEARRAWCMPLPDDECLQNENLHGMELKTSIKGQTLMCG